jgi:hypothetical protein
VNALFRQLPLAALALVGCRHTHPVRPGSDACTADPGAGCLQAAGPAGTLSVQNLSKTQVCSARFRSSAAEDWSEPVEDTRSIPTGLALDYQLEPGEWDVKLTGCKGEPLLDRLRVPLRSAGAVLTLPGG